MLQICPGRFTGAVIFESTLFSQRVLRVVVIFESTLFTHTALRVVVSYTQYENCGQIDNESGSFPPCCGYVQAVLRVWSFSNQLYLPIKFYGLL